MFMKILNYCRTLMPSKDKFIEEVFEILFGDGAVPSFEEGVRHFSYEEALEELKQMNNVYTEYLIKEKICTQQ